MNQIKSKYEGFDDTVVNDQSPFSVFCLWSCGQGLGQWEIIITYVTASLIGSDLGHMTWDNTYRLIIS